jgi:tRNA 2-thiouridine synthesizing protein A
MPILAATKQMRLLEPRQVLKVLATDVVRWRTSPHGVEDTGHELLGSTEEDGVLVFLIRKAIDA